MKIFRDRTCVVTGAASGIGRALAIELAANGARVAISDINMEGLKETAGMCGQSDVRSYKVDVSSRAEVFAHAEQVKSDFKVVHYVFNIAGVTLAGTVNDLTIEEIEWQFNQNLWSVIYGTKAFLPMLLAQREGHIVNMSSGLGLVGFFGLSAYCASKFAIRGLTETLWSELVGTGVKATVILPGGVKTMSALNARIGQNVDVSFHGMRHTFNELLITPPQRCARDILKGVAKGKKRIVTGHKGRTFDLFARLLPGRYTWFIKKYTKI